MFSEIKGCEQWLKQFNPEDRNIIKEMLDNLVYVSTDKFVSELEYVLIELIEKYERVAIIPVRELLDKDEKYYPQCQEDIDLFLGYEKGLIESKSLEKIKKAASSAITKEQIDTFSPVLINPSSLPGSESILANLITRLSRRFKKRVVAGKKDRNPSISDLKNNKCDNLILVDDVIGSGRRVYDFVTSVIKNKSINSWISSNHMELTVVSYMKANHADDVLRQVRQKVRYIEVHTLPTFYEIDEWADYEKIIIKYSNKKEKSPLGYSGVFARVVFEHSVPNNTPALLWRNVEKWKPNGVGIKHSGQWEAIFPQRTVPPDVKHGFGLINYKVSNKRKKITLALHVLNDNKKIMTIRQLARFLGWSSAEAHDVVEALLQNKLIEKSLKLTGSGLRELQYLSKHTSKIDFNSENYYPYSVMGGATAHTA